MLASARSAGFWSSVAAIVGLVAAVAGGILLLSVDEIRNFGLSLLIIGLSLLFLAMVLSPRAIAMFVVGRQGRYGTNAAVMTVAFFAIAILVNFLLFRSPTRFDVTATRVFSLAPQTAQILDNLDTTVRANAFFVPGDIRRAAARRQAEDLLNEFQRKSPDFIYRFVDPELDRSLAIQYGVTQYPTIVFEDLTTEVQQPIAVFTEQAFVTGILISTGVEQKRVYFLTGHREATITRDAFTGESDEAGFDFALEGMQRDNYSVVPLNLQQVGGVPENAAVLVIASPKQGLNDKETEALVAYIKRGGRIVALFDPDTPSSFVDIISQWGVTLGGTSIADAVSNVGGEQLTPLVQRTNGQFPPGVGNAAFITEEVDVAFFPEVTSVDLVMPQEEFPPFITLSPLAMSTPASWLETDVDDVSYSPGIDRTGPFFIATILEASGTVDESERHTLAKLVIFGDSDFARNKFFFSSQNADLLLNSINWLAEDFELISIRPKLVPFRELVVNTRERDFIKWSSWFLPPAFMIVLGGVVWWRRR